LILIRTKILKKKAIYNSYQRTPMIVKIAIAIVIAKVVAKAVAKVIVIIVAINKVMMIIAKILIMRKRRSS
jgi:hypothetical protein